MNDLTGNTTIYLEGMTSVSSLIKAIRAGSARRNIKRVLFSSEKVRSERGRLRFLKAAANELGFELAVVHAREIEAVASGKTHGGIVAAVTPAQYRDITRDDVAHLKNSFCVLIDGVEDPYSLGYTLRSLYACGASAVILPEHMPQLSDALIAKSSAGASELMLVYKTGDAAATASLFADAGFKTACAAIRDSVPCFEADLRKPLLLVIGGEKRGVSSALAQKCTSVIRIPYDSDFSGSLSSAAATSILAYEVMRQNLTS